VQGLLQALKIVTTCRIGGTEDNPIKRTVTTYRPDGATATSPFYNGINGGTNARRWIFDIPYPCENRSTPSEPGGNAGSSPSCPGGPADGYLLSVNWLAHTFLARDIGRINNRSATHDVILYGGEWWGFQYSNTDVPEPALKILTGCALVGHRRAEALQILIEALTDSALSQHARYH
jgi:hypothetical protein